MLRLTSPSATRPPLLKGEALSKNTLSGIFTNKKALLLGELAACTPERSKAPKDITRSLGRGRATPSPFFACLGRKKVRRRGDFNRIAFSHQSLAALLRMTCSNELRFYFLGFFGTPRTSSPTGLIVFLNFACKERSCSSRQIVRNKRADIVLPCLPSLSRNFQKILSK